LRRRAKAAKRPLDHLKNANNDANPELMRLALKVATGAGKTTVMAMIIAWQTINAVRRSGNSRFTRGFLVEVYNTERHLLYVACTRARDHLLATGVAPASEFLTDFVTSQ
jgi:superfamily I DNA/RNA helicase